MNDTQIDPLIKRAVADAVMQRAMLELNKLLVELAALLDPFPNFMGVSTIQAIEVEPGGASNPDNGCVVVCSDGELRELVLRMIPGPFEMGGVEQTEEMAELELPPGEYVAYAYAAVEELLKALETQQAR
ncbi:MAG: hypothetical protein OXG80_02690 [Chloroflexi bacterium]|nr:hypothetical protein [Chloroflexota bacterium]